MRDLPADRPADRPGGGEPHAGPEGTIAKRVRILITGMDIDHAPIVTGQELAAGVHTQWLRLDLDFSLIVTPVEFETCMKPTFASLARSGDGHNTRDELLVQIPIRAMGGPGGHGGGRQRGGHGGSHGGERDRGGRDQGRPGGRRFTPRLIGRPSCPKRSRHETLATIVSFRE
jgi:hypothetical protein